MGFSQPNFWWGIFFHLLALAQRSELDSVCGLACTVQKFMLVSYIYGMFLYFRGLSQIGKNIIYINIPSEIIWVLKPNQWCLRGCPMFFRPPPPRVFQPSAGDRSDRSPGLVLIEHTKSGTSPSKIMSMPHPGPHFQSHPEGMSKSSKILGVRKNLMKWNAQNPPVHI